MPKHVDLYNAFAMAPTYELIKALTPEYVARAGRDELPYWNGYVYYTEVHEDEECETYAPKDEDGNQLSPRFKTN